MGKKKNRDQNDTLKPTTQNDTDVFKSIFGHVSTAITTTLFSDDNPFKRKPQDLTQLSNSIEKEAEKKKKKEKRSNLYEELDKNEKIQLGNEKNGEIREVGIENESKKARKKRKRDDIEREYEEKKYGVVAKEEGEKSVKVGEKRKKADDMAELVVEKEEEGFDDESKLLRTVFVGNLAMKIKKKEILKEFSRFGDVESVRIRSVPITDTKITRKGAILLKKINDTVDSVHAYVVFKTEQSAEASLAHNMAVVGGNHIHVDRACPPGKRLKGDDSPLYDTKRTIFVGNLPFDVKDEEIYLLFCSFKDLESSIEAVRVVRHPHVGLGKGIAYVLFKTKEAVNLALKKRNVKLRDRELRLSQAKQDSAPLKKRRYSFPTGIAASPAKKLALDSNAQRSNVAKIKATMSYQGLRANKAGKIYPKRTVAMKVKSSSQKGEKRQVGKRLAVEKRKAKAKAKKDGGSPNLAGRKRKMDGQTPDSFKQKKKFKKLR